MVNNKENIKNFLADFGVRLVGFATVPGDIEINEIEEKFQRAIVFGLPLSKSILSTVKDRPSLIYKHHYKTLNWILDQTAFHLVRYLEENGNRAIAIPASQTVNWENQRGHISHKRLAVEAGLGFIGRSGLLIHNHYGAQVRYATVLTNLEFMPDKKITGNCGDCEKCIMVCPANAITKDGIDIKRCLAKLKEFSKIGGIGQFICGVCVKVCDGKD